MHVLWLVVLIKLVTPGVVQLDAIPHVREPEPAAPLALYVTGNLDDGELAAALPATEPAEPPVRWSTVSASVWVAGSVLFLILAIVQCARFARAMRAAMPADRVLRGRIETLARRAGTDPPRAHVIDATVPPMVWGGLRGSTLVLPARLLDRLTSDETDTLITHEVQLRCQAEQPVDGWCIVAKKEL